MAETLEATAVAETCFLRLDLHRFLIESTAGTVGAVAGVLVGSPFDVIKVS